MEDTMAPLTVFLGKLIGIFSLLVGLVMLMRKSAMIDTIVALVHDRPLVLVVTMLGIVAGLAIVLSHNVWRGGALAIVVTLCGWIFLIRGIVLLFLSPEQTVSLLSLLRYEDLFYMYAAIPLILGLYLIWASFRSPLR